MKYNLPAILFAGGKSKRMGSDKALLPFGEYSTLSEFQYRKLVEIFDVVYLSAKEDKFPFSTPLIRDKNEISAPLIALESIFSSLDTEAFFVLSVDTPLIDNNIVIQLIEAYKANPTVDAIVAKTIGGIHPLCAIYKRALYPVIKKAVEEKNYKLISLLEEVNTYYHFFEEEQAFLNLNHKETYEKGKNIYELLCR